MVGYADAFVSSCLELDLHRVGVGGVLIIPPFTAEASKDLNLALALGLPKGSSPSSLVLCVLCPGDVCAHKAAESGAVPLPLL